ncbi:AT-rich interactive domain-containing protein 4B-like isoform X3 [Melanaphis sacchari]|uniref:AT-rich interactive domain-containing protein 4B-like isoform X3 n=1 Tax=Melanaphis sacchari TaxID=742174 RepID=UPI000DC133C2|nr:AT-rich interactive domain-containing protein 4B-like isoform X3 [Melanaphis sacchari]XP_025196743.1 AT-rich interactive domain-containing protein 4B-like isoform X3 [Melanaphis sacchari]
MRERLPVNLDDPPFLAVGTEVSAKYKGAFCEAKIRKISKTVKCKVQYSNGISAFVTDDVVKGQLKVGATVDVKCSDKKELVRATIQKIQDCSQYTVVFDDGDITCLKRTALCLKSGKHFAASATLDQLPLTHPEHIGVTPVRTTIVQGRRSRKHKKSIGESGEEDASTMEEKDIGKVVCVEANDKKKVRDNWFPGLIVAPTSQSSVKTNVAEDYLVRSFKDGKYYTVPKKEITEFTKEIGARVENPTLKTAVEKALFFLDKDELPPHWDRDLLFGIDKICVATDSEAFDSDNSDEESIEEKDHFVAQLFKFMDDRGTPLNQAPVINEKDVDLYKLFKVVNNCGGYNKVNKGKLWKFVANKAGHEQQSCFSVKHCYQQYLHSFEDFYRKLGCTMLSHPRGVRSRSRFSRSIIRDVDKALPGTSSITDKNKILKNEPNDKKTKDSTGTKKTAKNIKAEEKLIKNNEEVTKKSDKKKDDITNTTSRSKQSVKWDLDIVETKDTVKNSKAKKEMKDILKKEIKKEIDSDTQDDDQIIEDKKVEKKKYTRNLFGKSVRKTTKKEKVVKVKSADTGLPGMRKMRAIKEQIKTFVKVMTPFKKSKRGANTQQDVLNKGKSDEEVPKLTRSKTKEDLPTKSRRISVLSDLGESASVVQLPQTGLLVENQIKIKKEEGSEKKKTVRKKKEDKDEKVTNDIIPTPVSNVEIVPFDKDSPVIVGDNLVVYYGDKQATTYDAKVINVCDIEGVMKYYVHYKGWNSRYDEWIDVMRIAYKTKDPEPGVDNDADSSKSSPPEQKSVDVKKVPLTTGRTRRSVTPLTSHSNIKKSPFSSARPTRTCTLTDRPLFNIDNSDSEGEYTVSVGTSKQYNKKKATIKSEPGIVIKTEPVDTENQKKTPLKTYPSKEVLMQRSAPRKPKSCVFKVHSNKSEEVEVCEQVTLKPPFDFNFVMPPPGDSLKQTADNENKEIQNEIKVGDNIKIETKVAPNHYLSPKEKSERNDLEHISESSKTRNEKIESETEQESDESRLFAGGFKFTHYPVISPFSHGLDDEPIENRKLFHSSSSEDEEQDQQKIVKKIVAEVISSSLDDKSDESKISGTDFDLNKIRSEMKGLMPTSSNCNNDVIQTKESFILDKQIEIEEPIEKINEPAPDDVYEFKESESCNLDTISSVTEEKFCRSIRHDSPKVLNLEKSTELPKVIESTVQEEVVEQNRSPKPFLPNSNNVYSFDDNVEIKDNENLNIINKNENPISNNQLGNESNESQSLIINDVTVDTTYIKEIDHSQDETCHEVNVSDIKNEVLDLCMKPPESPPNNIFSMPEPNEVNNMIVEEDDDDEDDDESKLVIAENDKIESDYQMDTDMVVISEDHNSSNGQINENIQTQSLPPLPPSVHPNIELEFKSSCQVKKDIIISKDTDDESTTSCNESIQNALIQSFQKYSHFENDSSKNRLYMDNIDDNTKSGFEFDSNSKSPTIENKEIVKSAPMLPINEPLNDDEPKKIDFEVENVNVKFEKEKPTALPELQCREEIVDEDTLNNALVVEYNRKVTDYDIHKPSTSKGFFDSIHQPSTSKDCFYKSDTNSDTKNNFFEARQAVKSVTFDTNIPNKSSLFDPNIPSCSSKDFYDHNIPSTSKSSFYENSLPSTSKSFYNPESDVNSVLFCEETIPGSPTGTSEEQYDQEERKKALQAHYEEREAASAMYAMNQSFRRPMITLMGATEEEMEEYSNILQNDEAILDQRHLQFLAEISSRNLGINISEPSVTEPSRIEPEPIVNKIVKPLEKPQTKRKISSQEQSSKRSKSSTTTTTTTAAAAAAAAAATTTATSTITTTITTTTATTTTPLPSVSHISKLPDLKTQIPLKDGKPLVVFTPDMDSAQRQAVIIARMNDLRREYAIVKARLTVVDRRRKKIKKRKRDMAKAAALNQNKQSQAASSTSTSK